MSYHQAATTVCVKVATCVIFINQCSTRHKLVDRMECADFAMASASNGVTFRLDMKPANSERSIE